MNGARRTAITGGTVVVPGQGTAAADVIVSGERIVGLQAPGTDTGDAEVVDARGLIVLPGVIDTHTHVGIGAGYEDFATESKAAALGGVTSYLLFLREPVPYRPLWLEARAAGEARSLVDFGFHAVLLLDEHLDELDAYVDELGITSFKLYMTYRGEDAAMRTFALDTARFGGIDDGFLLDALRAVARHPRALAIVHCENIEIVSRLRRRLMAADRRELADWNASRPPIAEVEAVGRLVHLLREAGGRAQILHTTTAGALAQARAARAGGTSVHVEVCHPYLAAPDRLPRDLRAKMRPPLREPEDVEALWGGLFDGTVDTIGSDHVPRPLAEKSGDIWSPTTGAAETPQLLPFLLTEGHHRRGLPLERVAQLTAETPARLYGLYPRKGSLLPGADADLTLVDLDREYTVDAAASPSHCDYSVYDGWTMRGAPVLTMVRGRIVMREGGIVADAGWGTYLSR